MSDNPVNLALRFFLELAGLGAMAYWGWTTHEGLARVLWTIGVPVLAATLWGVFRVPEELGEAAVAVPGLARLLLEAAFFGSAVWLLASAGQSQMALIFGVVILLHYLASYDYDFRLLTRG